MSDDVETLTEPEIKRKHRWFVSAVAGASVLALTVGVAYTLAILAMGTPSTFTAKGAVVISGTDCASKSPGYSDLSAGAGVTIKDPNGKVVGIGTLGASKDLGDASLPSCAFLFSVPGVPAGLGIYGVEVSHRGLIQFKESDLRKNGAVLGLADTQ